ncbi:MAG TPA: hypothetical protein PLU02_10775 [Chitinophagales bacterium]|nr:hypothetical protein [Chitinophagales bacterium]
MIKYSEIEALSKALEAENKRLTLLFKKYIEDKTLISIDANIVDNEIVLTPHIWLESPNNVIH